MKLLAGLILWMLLFVVCWPLALLVPFAWLALWLLSIPLRVVVAGVEALLALVKAILFLPARLFGYRPCA